MDLYVLGNIGKILGKVVEPLAKAIAAAFQAILEPIVKTLVTILANFIIPIAELFYKLFIAIFGPIMTFFAQILMQTLARVFFRFVSKVLVMITLSPEMVDKNEFVIKAIDTMQVLAISSLLLIGTYYGFKSFFAYFGFEAEEPWKLMVRGASTIFLIMAAPELCKFFLRGYKEIEQIIYATFGLASGGTLNTKAIENIGTDLFKGNFDPIDMVVEELIFLMIVIKTFKHFTRIAERYILMIVLIIFSPLAAACSFAKHLRNYFEGWLKMFVGTLVIQSLQVTTFAMMAIIATVTPAGFNFMGSPALTKCLLILGCLVVMEGAERISQIGGLGFGMDSGGQALGQLKNMAVSAAQTAYPAAGSIVKGLTRK